MFTVTTLCATKNFYGTRAFMAITLLTAFMLLPCWLCNNPVNGAGLPPNTKEQLVVAAKTDVRDTYNHYYMADTVEPNNETIDKYTRYDTTNRLAMPETPTRNLNRDMDTNNEAENDNEEHHACVHDEWGEETPLRIKLPALLRITLALLFIVVFI